MLVICNSIKKCRYQTCGHFIEHNYDDTCCEVGTCDLLRERVECNQKGIIQIRRKEKLIKLNENM